MSQVRVVPVEDGGNPRGASEIAETADGFVIRPFSEDGDMNYKFRLDVEVVNESRETQPTTFVIDWADEEYAEFRRYVLLSQGEAWWRLAASNDGPRCVACIPAPPGRSHLSMHPEYSHARLTALVASLDRRVFRVESAGKSLHGREMWTVEAGRKDGRPLVVITRVHPYESASSFFAEGMLEWLGTADARDVLTKQRIVVIPMPNPDGVAEGTCKRTVGGLDLNVAVTSAEPEGVALVALYRRLQPLATFNIHGYMLSSDGFATNDVRRGEAIAAALRAVPGLCNKAVAVREKADPEGGAANADGMSRREFGSSWFTGSWTWYERDAGHLRRYGAELLKAYAAQF